ncbi:ABC transporter ATP-binding protein [Candidatus Nitrosocosmicus franklandus]|uniref:Trehalose/maltose import ATP-binding protein MalK n=1 Tax=Candidatus Nitrosocosmicus franklandianus TaxID=1798806 RepID=A0A484I9M6_9ARCH|nr:ABC transporter ATP-binding protein [Candidatus Nitrosocosmicus franklandus]VFJ13522.1 Trehalose/maltose import ATP-binding protein MalK [Candidatus Nitrosocosmicus franklandus]
MVDLKIENLAKKYGETTALDGFSIDVKSGELMVILGPSGCGKTTAIRCIAGLTPPTSGHIYLGNKKINELSPKDRDVAMVFQNYALYPHMSVYDNIAFPLKMRKKPKSYIQEKVKQMADLLGINDLLYRKPKELSGGQMQRIALGRALVREPKLFLMDEPLSNLDAKLRAYMRTEIKKLQKKIGITTLYITHDQVEAMSMADRIAIMKNGNIQQIGTPMEVYHRPRNTFVGQFIGNPQMNLISGSIKDNTLFLFSQPIANQLTDKIKFENKLMDTNEFIVGIRPRDIALLTKSNKGTGTRLQGSIVFVEMLGDDTIMEINFGSGNLLVTTNNITNTFQVGDKIEFGLEYSKMHFFDKTGNRIE